MSLAVHEFARSHAPPPRESQKCRLPRLLCASTKAVSSKTRTPCSFSCMGKGVLSGTLCTTSTRFRPIRTRLARALRPNLPVTMTLESCVNPFTPQNAFLTLLKRTKPLNNPVQSRKIGNSTFPDVLWQL